MVKSKIYNIFKKIGVEQKQKCAKNYKTNLD